MPVLMCNETITLIKHIRDVDGDQYEPIVITGVSWFGKFRISPSESGASSVNEITVRIPVEAMPKGVTPETGDYVARGAVESAELDFETVSALPDVFEVLSVGDNRRGRLKHWRISGA